MPRSYFNRRGYGARRSGGGRRYGGKRRKVSRGKYFQPIRSTRKYLTPPGQVSIPSWNGGFPKAVQTCLKYDDTFAVTVTTGVNDTYYISGNSLFDPDASGTGHQPYGYDQLSLLYNRYVVKSCSIEVRIFNTNAGQTVSQQTAQVAVLPITDSLAITSSSVTSVGEMPNSKVWAGGIISNTNAGNFQPLIKHYFKTAQAFGVSDGFVQMDDAFGALVGANPTRRWYWGIKVNTFDTVLSSQVYWVNVRVRYYCTMYDQVILAPS